jgi:Hemerythrin HHE cation binding domain
MAKEYPMDITELILSQHHEQRRMFAQLDDVDPADTDTLTAIWSRLAILLEVHAEAEEKYFYPRLLEIGTGGGGQDSAAAETQDAIKDHNEIRDAVSMAGEHPIGSNGWWNAVAAARKANGDHMAEEEREDLPDFRRHADLQLRHDIAVAFLRYEARHADGIAAEDKDPKEYVDERS